MKSKKNHLNHRAKLRRDLLIIAASISLSILLAETGAVSAIIQACSRGPLITSFVTGWFFTSLFTTPFSIAAFAALAKTVNIYEMAFFGAVGAVLGDLVIFYFIRDTLAEDVEYLLRGKRSQRFVALFHRRIFRWLTPMLGALVIASPLPDELGISMMGLSKMRTRVLIPISFVMNFIGILAIGLLVLHH